MHKARLQPYKKANLKGLPFLVNKENIFHARRFPFQYLIKFCYDSLMHLRLYQISI